MLLVRNGNHRMLLTDCGAYLEGKSVAKDLKDNKMIFYEN